MRIDKSLARPTVHKTIILAAPGLFLSESTDITTTCQLRVIVLNQVKKETRTHLLPTRLPVRYNMIRSGEMLALPGMPDLLPRVPRSDDVRNAHRQSPWTSGHFSQLAGRTSQRNSPAGVELSLSRLSFEGHGMDPHSFTSIDDYPRTLASFSSPPRRTYSPPAVPESLPRPTPDQHSAVGYRSTLETHGSLGGTYPPQPLEGSHSSDTGGTTLRNPPRSRPTYNRDEFDGPAQLLSPPLPEHEQSRAQLLPQLPVNLTLQEQDEVARRTNDILSQCAFHFVAKYQFPIPIERDKRHVRQPADREWTEWAYLLKRLATKRRIPARVLFDGQIKQLVTTLENSIVVRQSMNARADPPSARQPRDDRYMLQLVSSGLQVAKILMDSMAMDQLNELYIQTETLILERRSRISTAQASIGSGRTTRGSRGTIGRGISSGSISGVGGTSGGGGGGGGGGLGGGVAGY